MHKVFLRFRQFSAKRIWERHNFLLSTVGVLEIEKVSYDNVTYLYYIIIWVFPLFSLIEICLYLLYQYKVFIQFEHAKYCEFVRRQIYLPTSILLFQILNNQDLMRLFFSYFSFTHGFK